MSLDVYVCVCVLCVCACVHFIKNSIRASGKFQYSSKTSYDKEDPLLFDFVQFSKLSVTHLQDELSCPLLIAG